MTPLTTEQLSRFSPLDYLTPRYRQQLCAQLKYVERPAGTLLLKQGGHAPAQYYLLSGKVEVQSAQGARVVEGGTLPAGQPLNATHPNPARVQALTDVLLMGVERQLLERLLAWSEEADYGVLNLSEASPEQQAHENWLEHLLSSPLFARLGPAHLQTVLASFEYLPCAAGETVMHYGEPGEYFYVIKRGRARICLPECVDKPATHILGAGDFFGEEALASGAVRSASVIMLEDGELGRLHRDVFNRWVRPTMIPQVSSADLANMQQSGPRPCQLLDVRLPAEYRLAHLPQAHNLPVASLRAQSHELDPASRYIVTAEGGHRSELAVYLLNQFGFDAYLLRDEPATGG